MDDAAPTDDTASEARARELELERLATRDGQAGEYRDALMQALTATNLELSANGIQPRIDSVIEALTMLQAEFVAMYPHRGERRRIIAEVEANLPRLVTLRTSTGTKPARELAPDRGEVN